MSLWYNAGNATLGEIIRHLEELPLDMPVVHGFTHAHSYRGFYEDLAFEPTLDTTVGAMLAVARGALGKVFEGYKGGDYRMTTDTDCWLADYGETGVPIVVAGKQKVYELPEVKS